MILYVSLLLRTACSVATVFLLRRSSPLRSRTARVGGTVLNQVQAEPRAQAVIFH